MTVVQRKLTFVPTVTSFANKFVNDWTENNCFLHNKYINVQQFFQGGKTNLTFILE